MEQKFAVDVFAKSNGLVLTDRKKAKEISAVVLDGNKIGLYSVFPVEGKFPEELKLCETEEFLRNYPYGIRLQEEVAKGGKKRRFWIFRRRTWCWESDVAKGFPKKKSKARSMRQKRSLDLQKRKSLRSTVLI